MNTKDGFVISAFKMLLSVVAVAIMLPLAGTDVSFYVTVSVYVLGKFIDLVSKVMERHIKLFFVIYLIGVVVGILAVGMCFYAFATIGLSDEVSNTLKFDYVLLVMTVLFCFIDVADFVWCICRLSYTKAKLKQFG